MFQASERSLCGNKLFGIACPFTNGRGCQRSRGNSLATTQSGVKSSLRQACLNRCIFKHCVCIQEKYPLDVRVVSAITYPYTALKLKLDYGAAHTCSLHDLPKTLRIVDSMFWSLHTKMCQPPVYCQFPPPQVGVTPATLLLQHRKCNGEIRQLLENSRHCPANVRMSADKMTQSASEAPGF